MNFAKELNQENLNQIFSSASIIWNKFPEIKAECFCLIERPHHIWDWCEEKDLYSDDFCDLVASRFLKKFSEKFLIEIYYTKDVIKIKSNYFSSVGYGKNLMFAISDFIVNTKIDFALKDDYGMKDIKSFVLNLKSNKIKN